MSNPRHLAQFIVAWDFPRRPSTTFYRVLRDEFTPTSPGGPVCLIQRSVALCRDDFTAHSLGALAESFGARVACYAIKRESFGQLSDEARMYIERVLLRRLEHRGGKRGKI
jgi:hypothetical protein